MEHDDNPYTHKQNSETLIAWIEGGLFGWAIVTPDGIFRKVNQTLCKILKRTENELIGTSFAAITPAELLPWDMANVNMVMQGEKTNYIMPKVYEIAPKEYVFVIIHPVGIRKQGGEFSHFSVLILPTTLDELKKMQIEMVGKIILPPELLELTKAHGLTFLIRSGMKYRKEVAEAVGWAVVLGSAIAAGIIKALELSAQP
jgi:hypothetical protein